MAPLTPFSLEHLRPGSAILVLGKSRTGKTSLCREILRTGALSESSKRIIINPTEVFNPEYDTGLPVYNRFAGDAPASADATADDADADLTFDLNVFTNTPDTDPCTLIVDGGGPCTRDTLQGLIDCLVNRPRTTLVMTFQYPGDSRIPRGAHWDYIVMFEETFQPSIKKLFEHCGAAYGRLEPFEHDLAAHAKGHQCLVVDQKSKRAYVYETRAFKPKRGEIVSETS